MLRSSTRVGALALLFFLIAAQAHVWIEAVPAGKPGHICQFCVAANSAIVSASPGVLVNFWAARLESEPPAARATNQPVEVSCPRAPPLS